MAGRTGWTKFWSTAAPLAAARSSKVASVAYEAARETRPNAIVKLRQKALVLERIPDRLRS